MADDLGQWWIKDPIDRAAEQWYGRKLDETTTLFKANGSEVTASPAQPWWWKYRSGLDCPFCVGFWIAVGVVAVDAAVENRPAGQRAWRLAAASLTLNYVAAHLGSRLGDTAQVDTEIEEPA